MELIGTQELFRFIAALALVLALMGGLALIMRRVNQGGGRGSLSMPGKRRLSIVESLPIDMKRRLVLIRRDNREHLVILGATGETVIESGIESRHDEPVQPATPAGIE